MIGHREVPQPLLLIDDDPTFTGFIATALSRAGLFTNVVSTGRAGLEALDRHSFSLVLLDLVLPDIDGLEILRRLNSEPSIVVPPVILISGLGTIRSAVEAIRLGARDFVEKPLVAAELVDTVRSYLPTAIDRVDTDDSAVGDLVRWVMTVVLASTDTRTIDEWSVRAGASTATIFARCKRVDIGAKSLLDLGRLVRIAVMPRPRPKEVLDALRTRDVRTVGALLGRAEITRGDLDPGDPKALLGAQRLVENARFIEAFSHALAASPALGNHGAAS